MPAGDHTPAPRRLPADPIGPFGPTSAFGHLTFTDDHATIYQAHLSGGAIESSSPALGRLAALARRLGIADGRELLATGVPPELPEAWNSVLADRDRHDGRDGLAPVAAVLPELDGARFAITGLWSTSQSATLRALAWGWRSRRAPFPPNR